MVQEHARYAKSVMVKSSIKTSSPLDHPNGMCTMEPVVMDEEEMLDELAAWVKGEGDYPEIDKFAKKFGYEPSVKKSVSKATGEAV